MGKQLDSQLRGYRKAPGNMKKDPTYPIFELGLDQGSRGMQAAVLTWLENKYIGDSERPDRGSPKAQAILELTRELAQFMRETKIDGVADVTPAE